MIRSTTFVGKSGSFVAKMGLGCFLSLAIVTGCSASADSGASSGDEQDVTSASSSGSIESVAYSDLGNVITIAGKTPFWEGSAQLFVKNESDANVNAKLPGSGDVAVLASATVQGENGLSSFQAEFTTGSAGADTVPVDGECVGLYVGTARGDLLNVGAFSYCKDDLSGRPSACGTTKIYASSEACLAEKARLVSVTYSDLGNAVEVHGQASFFEGQASIIVRNETSSADNHELPNHPGAEYRGFGEVTVHSGSNGNANGVSPFDASFQVFDVAQPEAASARKDDCIGVYQVNDGRGGLNLLGAFKYGPDDLRGSTPTPKQYFYTVAQCLKAR